MEFWIVLAIVGATGGWLAFRAVKKFRRTLRGEDRCGGDCDCGPAVQPGSKLTPPEALVRKSRERRASKGSGEG